MAGLRIRPSPAGCGHEADFISLVEHLDSVISCRMCFPCCIQNLHWRVNRYCCAHQDNLRKEMFSIGGIRQLDEVSEHIAQMITYGCLM